MSTNHPYVEIIEVQHEQLDDAVSILARAFENDPTTRYLFSGHASFPSDQAWELYLYVCEMHLDHGYPIIGVKSDSQLVGIACIQPPGTESPSNPESSPYEIRFGTFIGKHVMKRVMGYARVTSEHIPEKPHFYLTALGVHPDEQGKGYARALLDAVHHLSDVHPASIGFSLDTGNPVNVPMYEHCGYRITAKTKLEELDLWCMFRSKESCNP